MLNCSAKSAANGRLLEQRGFALVVTLLMLVLAAGIAVGLLTSASLDRGTSRAALDRYQAELAVQNGLEAAKRALTPFPSPSPSAAITNDDGFLVVRVDGPAISISPSPSPTVSPAPTPSYYFLAKAGVRGPASVDYYPLFSGGAPTQVAAPSPSPTPTPNVVRPTPPPNPDPSDATAAIQTNRAKTAILKAFPEVSAWLSPASTKWVEVVDPNDSGTGGAHTLPYQRYAFWVEDLAGYVDAGVAGNESGSGGKHQRSSGTDPKEIALFTIFAPTAATDTGSTDAKKIIDNRSLLLTVPTLKQVADSQPDAAVSNLALRCSTDLEQAVVPRGFGYGSEGSPKKNLNERLEKLRSGGITSAALVSDLGTWINSTLPQFKTRGGGMIAQDYLDNIAANIIDYADTDDTPTTGNSNRYRGIDSFPLLISLYDLCEWTSTNAPQPPSTTWTITIKKTTYIQIWNMTDKTLSGTLKLSYNNSDTIRVNTSTVPIHNTTYDTVSVTDLKPNEFRAIKMPVIGTTDTKTYTWGSTQPASNAYVPFTPQNDTNTATLSWNGVDVDRTLGGLRHPVTNSTGNNSMRLGQRCWHGNTAAPIFPAVGSFGDPRASWFLNNLWKSATYDSTSYWGGRIVASSFQLQPSTWPDSGHDFQQGLSPNGDTEDPPAVVARVTQNQTMAPAKFNNTGAYFSTAELGNVFDPAKWTINGTGFSAANNGGDIPSSTVPAPGPSATPSNDNDGGGGYTLRIGRPEFTKFDQNLMRAWQLLDIFAAGAKTDASPRISTAGLINVNTASRETLRALGAAIVNADGALTAPLTPPSNSLQADRFADAVLAARPFLSTAQLSTIMLDPAYVADPAGMPPGPSPQPFFGNPKQWPTSVRPSQLSDLGFEDLFGKIYGLSAVHSRNFRVFVTGQFLDKTGAVLSTVSRVFQVALKPTRAADGSIQSTQIQVTYESQL